MRPGCRRGCGTWSTALARMPGKRADRASGHQGHRLCRRKQDRQHDHAAGRRHAEAGAFRTWRQEPGHRVRRRRPRPGAGCRDLHDLLAERRALHLVVAAAGRRPRSADDFTAQLVERVNAIKVGHPLDPETEVGPLIHTEHLDKVTSYFDVARQDGATIAAGGERVARHGLFRARRRCSPSATHDMRDRAGGDLRPGSDRHPLRDRGRGAGDRQ